MGHADERKLGLQIGLCGCIGEYVRYFHGRWAIIQDLVVLKRKLYGKLISCRGLELDWFWVSELFCWINIIWYFVIYWNVGCSNVGNSGEAILQKIV